MANLCPYLSQVSGKKQRDTAAQDAEIKKQQEQKEKGQGSDKENSGQTGEDQSGDLLGDKEDDDVIF